MSVSEPQPEGASELSAWLIELREKLGLSQKEAAQAAGTSERSIRRWESGDVPNGLDLLKLLSAYGVRLVPPQPEGIPLAVNAELQAFREALVKQDESARKMIRAARRLVDSERREK